MSGQENSEYEEFFLAHHSGLHNRGSTFVVSVPPLHPLNEFQLIYGTVLLFVLNPVLGTQSFQVLVIPSLKLVSCAPARYSTDSVSVCSTVVSGGILHGTIAVLRGRLK